MLSLYYDISFEDTREKVILYLGGGGGSLSVGEFGILSTVAYPPPQQDPSNGERSLAL